MKRVSPLALAALAVGIAVLLALPHALKPYGIYLISAWAVFSIAAIGLNLTLGYAGQVSLAQAAFVGIGAYTAALLTTSDWPFFVAFTGLPDLPQRGMADQRHLGDRQRAPAEPVRHLHESGYRLLLLLSRHAGARHGRGVVAGALALG
ncbi:MAG: hypothetical protein K0S06_1077 [Microvirga sp.]|nr:hypothetical protein [Microvirga sp.]